MGESTKEFVEMQIGMMLYYFEKALALQSPSMGIIKNYAGFQDEFADILASLEKAPNTVQPFPSGNAS